MVENETLAQRMLRLRKLVQSDPNDGVHWKELGDAYVEHNELIDARICYEHSVAAHPNDEEARLGLARLMAGDGDFKGAINSCKKILESNPVNEKAPLLLMGDSFLGLGSLDSGEQCYAVAANHYPTDSQVLAGLASIHLLQGRDQVAENELNDGLASSPNSPELHLALAQIYFGRKDFSQTRAYCGAALACNPGCVKAYATIGMVDLLEEKAADATATASKGLKIAPTDADCLLVAAQACEMQNQFIETAEFAQRAVESAPQNHNAHLLLARAEISLRHDLPKAHKHLVLAEKLASSEKVKERVRNLRVALEKKGITST